jgi:hypothetical protein
VAQPSWALARPGPFFTIIAIFLTLLIAAIQPVPDSDFWWHLPTGNWILSHHAVPRHDLFPHRLGPPMDHARVVK